MENGRDLNLWKPQTSTCKVVNVLDSHDLHASWFGNWDKKIVLKQIKLHPLLHKKKATVSNLQNWRHPWPNCAASVSSNPHITTNPPSNLPKNMGKFNILRQFAALTMYNIFSFSCVWNIEWVALISTILVQTWWYYKCWNLWFVAIWSLNMWELVVFDKKKFITNWWEIKLYNRNRWWHVETENTTPLIFYIMFWWCTWAPPLAFKNL
jgi:hypothetical protein